ncbi:MAG: hypothetical protein JWQ01_2524 [Massilia sp.]|nr:hypothetical protein [Massilia sp.]
MKPMRPLVLDHQAPKRRPAGPMNALALVALACNIACGLYYADLGQQRQALLQPAAPRAAAVTRRSGDLQAELLRANDSVRAFGLPWADVFGAIEGAATADVSLLALDPMPDKRMLKLHAEARNMDAVLAYLRALAANAALASVSLQSHQVQQADSQHPVRFLVLVEWRARS